MESEVIQALDGNKYRGLEQYSVRFCWLELTPSACVDENSSFSLPHSIHRLA